MEIRDSLLQGCYSDAGGAVAVWNARAFLYDSVIADNYASKGGAVFVEGAWGLVASFRCLPLRLGQRAKGI